jgi:hypothetical protein
VYGSICCDIFFNGLPAVHGSPSLSTDVLTDAQVGTRTKFGGRSSSQITRIPLDSLGQGRTLIRRYVYSLFWMTSVPLSLPAHWTFIRFQ